MDYRTIIGLEVHAQLLTRTKLFCGCSTQFGLPPNSATCPVCCGLPGALPVLNRQAFALALKAALALNCRVAPFTKWDRKNYFYPDLPKNYQISQYDLPFSTDGSLEIETEGVGPRPIGIIRAHLEEDAGKMLHDEHGAGRDSLVDLNRTGTPLLEIVSQPELETAEQAKAYLEAIRLLLREIEVSDCEMQEGSLRCDANVNLHVPLAPFAALGKLAPPGKAVGAEGELNGDAYLATPIVEIKNLNSIRGVERAIKYEVDRQYAELKDKLAEGEWVIAATGTTCLGRTVYAVCTVRGDRVVPVSKATAGWDDRLGRTEIQRRKEEAADYRYFPEPDLVPVTVDDAALAQARAELGELPAAQKARLQTDYALSAYDAGVLARNGRALVAFFEATAAACGLAKEACNWIANDLLQTLNERKISVKQSPLTPAQLAELILAAKALPLNKQRAREVYAVMLDGLSAQQAIDQLGFKAGPDETQLRELIRKAIAANPKAVSDFKNGKVKAADALKGAVMRETKGMAPMDQVQQILLQELAQV